VLALLAVLPPTWLAPWSADAATIAFYPLRPIEWSFARFRGALRPAPVTDDFVEERLRELTEDRDHYRALWFAERMRTGEMAERLAAVEGVARVDRSGSRPIAATIVSQAAGPGSGLLVVDAGLEMGVQSGDPLVTNGDRLVGRIAADPSERRSVVVPITHRSNGRIDALVEPGSGSGTSDEASGAFVPLQLTPIGGGRFSAEVAAGAGVAVGDVVRLADPTWKRAAQGMRIGTVRVLRPLDENPLRLRVEVESDLEAVRAVGVVIKCEEAP